MHIHDDSDRNAAPVEAGLALVYTKGVRSRVDEYLLRQQDTRTHGRGLWECKEATLPLRKGLGTRRYIVATCPTATGPHDGVNSDAASRP